MRRDVVFLALALLALLALAAGAGAETPAPRAAEPAVWNLPGKGPHLIAHYVDWFQVEKSPTDATPTWTHWKWDGNGPHHDPEQRRPNGLRDIASVYYPLIGPYRSWSRAV